VHVGVGSLLVKLIEHVPIHVFLTIVGSLMILRVLIEVIGVHVLIERLALTNVLVESIGLLVRIVIVAVVHVHFVLMVESEISLVRGFIGASLRVEAVVHGVVEWLAYKCVSGRKWS